MGHLILAELIYPLWSFKKNLNLSCHLKIKSHHTLKKEKCRFLGYLEVRRDGKQGLTFLTASVSWNGALGILFSYCLNQVHFYSFYTNSLLISLDWTKELHFSMNTLMFKVRKVSVLSFSIFVRLNSLMSREIQILLKGFQNVFYSSGVFPAFFSWWISCRQQIKCFYIILVRGLR